MGYTMDDKYAPKKILSAAAEVNTNLSSGKEIARNSLGKIAAITGLSDVAKKIKELLSNNLVENSSKSDLVSVFDVTWGAKYLFMVRIQGGIDSPLDDYVIPASDASETISGVGMLDIPLPTYSGFKIPNIKDIPEISVTMYDTEDCMVEKSIRSWLLETNDGVTCNYIENAYRDLSIYKLNYERDIVLETKYKVIPKGDIKISMSSKDSSARELVVNFMVIDYLG